MDHRKRKWIVSNKWDEYLSGVNEFLNFAFRDDENGKVPCPYQRCVNRFSRSREEVFTHLVEHRMLEGYDTWYCHGEFLSDFIQVQNLNVDEGVTGHNDNQSTDKDMMEMLHDIFGAPTQPQNMDLDENLVDDLQLGDVAENSSAFLPHDIQRFNDFIKDVDSELYPGCKKFNRLSFLLHLYHIKCRYGWSNTSFDALVKLLKEAFPDGATLPSSFRESQKIVDGLGLNYEKIDACPNDCMLFWKDKVNDEECSICHASRWKDGDKNENASVRKKKKIPAKVLRYFPLKPRLQRLFMSSKIANDMTWHENERKKDGVLRHPADSEAWKCLDTNFPDFHAEPRNVRLGLATDGFNPFGRMDSTHSIWPVIVIPYNLPPWLCMKKENFILSLLIPGPKSPGNDIDVYLQPLIEELVELWELGAPTLDASTGEVFQMHAALLWTINDFPALGNLSGWNVYSEFGCPSCNVETHSKRLKYGHKFCFMDHDRFLNDLTASRPPSGEKVLEQLKNINFTFGKLSDEASGVPDGTWKKKSEFFKLPYWKHLLIRHNLDMMHVEKNVCDNIVNTLLNIEKKSKDNLSARRDLKKLRIRKRLWPQRRGQSGRWLLRKKEDGGLLKIVKSKFIIPHPLAEKFVMSSMGKKWSNFKTELKLQYCEPCCGNITNVLSNKPDIVPKDQWVSLVTYWFSDSGKRRSLINRKSREQQVMVHTAGAKSFAVLYAEKTVNGVPPSRAHVYLESHKDRKTRPAPMDAKSQQAVDMIKEKLSQLPNGIEVTNGNVAWDGDVYSQVMKEVIGPERSGRVRGLGRGPSSLASMSPNQEEHIDTEDHDVCDERIEFLEVQIAKMKEKQEEDAEIQNQLRNELSIIKAMLLGRTPNDHVPS